MTHYTCDRCGGSTNDPKHHRVLGADEPLGNWKNHFGWTPPDGTPTALRTHVKVSISAPGVEDNLELCARCFADLTVAALRTLTEKDTTTTAAVHHVVTQDVRMVALLDPSADPTRRCACEAGNCHERGDCRNSATVQVEAFGNLQSLCDRCAVTAVVADVLRQVGAR